MPDSERPHVSVVIPIHNEETILEASVEEFLEGLRRLLPGRTFELLLAENGSRDATQRIARQLAERHPEVRLVTWPEPNYGAALKKGILEAEGRFVHCDEIDLCDLDFHRRALALLEEGRADFVVGSKAMPGARDHRPLPRRLATLAINSLLRVLVGFRGTDTHGLKAFVADRTRPVVHRCVVDKDLFSSELVIRAAREGLCLLEIPVEVREKRRPSINLLRRVPTVLKDLATLVYLFRIRS